MAKNNKLINDLLRINQRKLAMDVERASEVVTPKIYASFAVVLSRTYGWSHEDITKLFNATQDIWAEYGWKICEMCYEETGILLENPEDAERNGDL